MTPDWFQDPSLAGIDPAKLVMLQSLADQGKDKSQNELIGLLMSIASGSKKGGMQFTPEEFRKILQVLQTNKSPKEVARMTKMINIMKLMNR